MGVFIQNTNDTTRQLLIVVGGQRLLSAGTAKLIRNQHFESLKRTHFDK